MAKVRREAVLDVHAGCDQVLQSLYSRDPSFYFESMGRLVEKGEKRGARILVYASPRKGRMRIELRVDRRGDRITYELRGDARGQLVVTAVPKAGVCRVYIEAEAEGKLIDEYGGEALSRAVNRVTTSLVSVFPAILQPRLPSERLGDVLVELLRLLAIAHQGPVGVKASSIRALTVNTEDAAVIAADGVGDEEAAEAARGISEAFKALARAAERLGVGQPQRIAMVTESATIYASLAGGVAVVSILGREGEGREG